jgi:hypothetical protein
MLKSWQPTPQECEHFADMLAPTAVAIRWRLPCLFGLQNGHNLLKHIERFLPQFAK